MRWWLLFVALLFVLILVFGIPLREYVILESGASPGELKKRSGPGSRPCLGKSPECAAWESKLDAEMPIGANDADYIAVLQRFYDEIYNPLRTTNPDAMPKDTDVEVFLNTVPGNIDKGAIRQTILSGFMIDRTVSASSREEKQLASWAPKRAEDADFKNIEPKDGILQTWKKRGEEYIPADKRIGELPEGIYKPTTQQAEPRREGKWEHYNWSLAMPYGVEDKMSS